MVDGADKVNNIYNNNYFVEKNVNDNNAVVNNTPLPLVQNKTPKDYLLIEKAREKDLIFAIPENAPQNAKDFIRALKENKESLMSDLKIDSKTYDMLAQPAVAIARKETNFGGTGDRIYKAYREIFVRINRFLSTKYSINKMNYSRGMTNLKYTLHIDDKTQPLIKDRMLKYGIHNEYQLNDNKKSAIATIILLSNFNDRIDKYYSEGFKQSQEKYGTTKIDALCAMWNGGESTALVKGDFNSQEWIYTQKIHEYMDEYKVISK